MKKQDKDRALSVLWTPEVRRRVWALIDNIDTEVGGFGYAALEKGGTELTWYDVFLVPQEVSRGSVDYESPGLTYAVDRASADGVLGRPDHVWVSWHSHNTMDAFWSATDEECIETYGGAGVPALLSFVGNHAHAYKARVDMFRVRHYGIELPKVTMGDLEIELDCEEPEDPFVEAIKGEIDEFVKRRYMGTGILPRRSRRGRRVSETEEEQGGLFMNVGGRILRVGEEAYDGED